MMKVTVGMFCTELQLTTNWEREDAKLQSAGDRDPDKGPMPRPLFLWDSLLDLPTESLSGNGRQGLIPRSSCFLSVLKHISALRFWLYGYGHKELGSFRNTVSNLRKYKLQRQILGTQLSKQTLTHSSIHLYVTCPWTHTPPRGTMS